LGCAAKALRQFRTINPALQRIPSFAAEPNEGHAIGYYKVRVTQNFLERRIVLSLYDAVHTGNSNEPTRRTTRNPALYPADNLGNLDSIHTHPKHVVAGGGGCSLFNSPQIMCF
jgi:hypothetical protein